MIEFLNGEVGKEVDLIEVKTDKNKADRDKSDFEKFSEKFYELFARTYPKASCLNRGRTSWKHKGIQERLKDISKYSDGKYVFSFEKGGAKNSWRLRKGEAAVSQE